MLPDLVVLVPQLARPRLPRTSRGAILRPKTAVFFEVFACGKHPTREMSDIDKTLAGAIRNALRSCRAVAENVQKSIRKRFRPRWAMRRALTGVLGVVPNALGASPKRPEAAIGRFLAALDAPGVPQDRLWGGTWGFKGRPRQVWTRSCNGLGRLRRPKIDFSSMLGRFGLDFW